MRVRSWRAAAGELPARVSREGERRECGCLAWSSPTDPEMLHPSVGAGRKGAPALVCLHCICWKLMCHFTRAVSTAEPVSPPLQSHRTRGQARHTGTGVDAYRDLPKDRAGGFPAVLVGNSWLSHAHKTVRIKQSHLQAAAQR